MGRLALYFRYSTRSLRRGGQRTVLGIFCIAVGVMAIVALRLAGDMITASLTSNVRQANGGDVSLVSTAVPLTSSDLGVVRRLQQRGVVQRYVALGVERGTIRRGEGKTYQLSTLYVLDDPSSYPLVGDPGFVSPPGTTYAGALSGGPAVVLTQYTALQAGLVAGDTIHLNLVGGGGTDVRVGGIIANQLLSNVGTSAGFIDASTFNALSTRPETYGVVEMTTADDAAASQAATSLRTAFPLATVQTVPEAINANVQAAQQVTQYLEIIGLLALAIGGIGIVNTLQVMLSRRRIEIAMLKTAGFRRGELYAMFGLEVGILGLVGGLLGTAAGVGMSLAVKVLIEQVISSSLVFTVSAGTLLIGIAVGVVTSLIFGLLPIVRAAAIRPLAVLRDAPEGRAVGSAAQTIALYALVAVLFIGLAASILGDIVFALQLVLYALIGLLLLGGIFSLVVTIVGHLPVPERFTTGYVLAVAVAVAVAALVTLALRGVGVALLIFTGMGFVVVLLPRSQRTVVKLALRSIGRSRARMAGTLVALFVGVFTIGLILVVGQDISTELSDAFNNLASYNVFVIASSRDAASATSATAALPGLQGRRITEDLPVSPVSIDGVPLGRLIGGTPASNPTGRNEFDIFELTGVEGYALGAGQSPGAPAAQGRTLRASDAGTDNVVVPMSLRNGRLNVALGDTIAVRNPATGAAVALDVVGFYTQAERSSGGGGVKINFFFEPILGDRSIIDQLGPSQASTIVSLKLDPSSKVAALRAIQTSVPNATVLDLADLSALVQQVLGNLVDLLIGIASLALFAGAVIIANTVALAMLERRREIGILKSTGYTSRSVLAQVLVENAVVGGIGAVAGILMVSAATALLGRFALKTSLAVSTPLVLAVMAGVVLLTMAVAGLVAWGPSRVRPLEVLRYE